MIVISELIAQKIENFPAKVKSPGTKNESKQAHSQIICEVSVKNFYCIFPGLVVSLYLSMGGIHGF